MILSCKKENTKLNFLLIFIITFFLIFNLSLVCISNDNSSAISSKTLKKGEILKIELKENVSTGYFWQYEMSNKNILIDILDKYVENADEKILGKSGKHIWYFYALQKGKTKITFKLKKESNYSIEKEKIYKIKIINQ